MRRGRCRWACVFLAICMIWSALPGYTIEALAAAKTISKVTIYADLDLSEGDKLSDLDLDTGEGSGGNVYAKSDKYRVEEAEWSSSGSKVKIGGAYTIKVTLMAEDTDEYAFKGSYKSSNVTVKGAEFVSASRKNNEKLVVTIRTKPMEGEFEAPDDAEWKEGKLGTATWKSADHVDAYDVTLYRGGSSVYKVKAYKGTKIDFYPYMTKAGTYSFKVRSVPEDSEQKDYAESSDWIESDEIYIAKEDVSDGSGQIDYNNAGSAVNGSTAQVGWIADGGRWWYRYPDGSYQKDSWLLLGGVWYLFDKDGWMLTGWQEKDGNWYFLADNGAMLTGWIQASDGMCYLNPGPEGIVGAMYRNQWLAYDNKLYYLGENGRRYEGWRQVGGNWYYFYPGDGSLAMDTVIDTFYVGPDGVWRK